MTIPQKGVIILDNDSGIIIVTLSLCYRIVIALLSYCYRYAIFAAIFAFPQSPTNPLFCMGGYVCMYAKKAPVLGRSSDFYEKRHKNSSWR
ncbi:MAG: hypothetical protein HPY45_09930 [Anaerolineae bacterium]|nr:hypothetical protein [Anaerolineae bacterium]